MILRLFHKAEEKLNYVNRHNFNMIFIKSSKKMVIFFIFVAQF